MRTWNAKMKRKLHYWTACVDIVVVKINGEINKNTNDFTIGIWYLVDQDVDRFVSEIASLELADASRVVTTRRWWITTAITTRVVTYSATQITGDAAYYTTNVGGWRAHNVVVHALL